jgi:hypothetical protein
MIGILRGARYTHFQYPKIHMIIIAYDHKVYLRLFVLSCLSLFVLKYRIFVCAHIIRDQGMI